MKFKKIPPEYFPVILDRITRFEPAYARYERVFDDIINKFLIDPKHSVLFSLKDKISIVEEIFNSSLPSNSARTGFALNPLLKEFEDKYFISDKKTKEISYQYLSARLDIITAVRNIKLNSNSPKNLIWLKKIAEQSLNQNITFDFALKLRKDFSLLYPVEKIILTEGETERILLNTCLKMFGVDMDKMGYLLIAPGGKSKVARKYFELLEYTKIPIFVLLDSDALNIKEQITLKKSSKKRENDLIYILKSGEFEDLIPRNVIKDTINFLHKNDLKCTIEDFSDDYTMIENLKYIYRKYGFGEYKKAHFASSLREFLEQSDCSACFKNSEFQEIAQLLV